VASVARVAVAKGKRAFGVGGDGPVDWQAYEVVELVDALTRTYRTDAHLVTYVVPGAAAQPRINKTGLALVPVKPVVEAFFCDVDNEHHAPWSADAIAAACAEEEGLPPLATAGVYYTAHGRRIVQPIAEPIPVEQVEPYVRRWLRELESAGLAVDWHCRDWTRHFRLPNVRRAGQDYRSPRIALGRMRAIEIPPLAAAAPAEADASNEPRHDGDPLPALEWTREVPQSWVPKVQRLAAAVRSVEEAWHPLFLNLAGALLASGVPPEHVPVVCRSVSAATGADTRTEDREAAARCTVQRKLAGRRVTGLAAMRRQYPVVAQVLEDVTARGARARAHAHHQAPAELPPVAESVRALEDAIRTAPPGVTLLSAECGLGKTQAAIRVAMERAAAGQRTAISVDKNALARQIAGDIERAGGKVLRLFGPLSVLRDDGTPECRFHETARLLAEGGQSVRQVMCEGGGHRCEHWNDCRARDGREGPKNATIVVGPHALLPLLQAAVGDAGLLVIDEPPPLVETTKLPLAEIESVLGSMYIVARPYAASLEPVLRSARAWATALGEPEKPVELRDAVQVKCEIGDDGSFAEERIVPIHRAPLLATRNSPMLARHVAMVSRVCGVMHAALVDSGKVSVRLSARRWRSPASRTVLLCRARDELRSALCRPGPTVVLDANAELHAPLLPAVIDRDAPMRRFRAPDGAPIQRVHLCTAAAGRARWRRGGRVVLGRGVLEALTAALEWAREDPHARVLGLLTFRPLELAITASLRPEATFDADVLREAGVTKGALAELGVLLRPVLDDWHGEIRLGHYGGMRGLDSMADVDCLVTFGDPWPNLDVVRHDVAFFGLPQTWERRVEDICRAELEQAHGRVRAVHRRRPGRALHVGTVLPGGSGWEMGRVERRTLDRRRPTRPGAMDSEELRGHVNRLGGIRATARVLGCSPPTVHRYLGGRAVPEPVAADIRAASVTGSCIS
jgi:hypothetical protein